MVSENLDIVNEKIVKACRRAGRKREDVLLVAVSKTKPDEMIVEAYEHGHRDFGENKPQEIRDKSARLSAYEDINWHMIGSLQKNKIKYVVPTAKLIHSIDSLELAEAVNEAAEKKNVCMPVLLEVNIACEESKHGFTKEEVYESLQPISKMKNIKLVGLMTVAPATENPEDNRKYFKGLKEMLTDINSKNIENIYLTELSMGMTGDYEIAIEEGATIVRVGTGIFGERNYNV